jgi:hypothetical protein
MILEIIHCMPAEHSLWWVVLLGVLVLAATFADDLMDADELSMLLAAALLVAAVWMAGRSPPGGLAGDAVIRASSVLLMTIAAVMFGSHWLRTRPVEKWRGHDVVTPAA